jgi:hypothetical protein
MPRDAAAIEDAIQLRKPVVNRAAFEIVDDDGNARDALGFGQIAHDLWGLQMMQKQAAGDDIDARVGKRKIESIAR